MKESLDIIQCKVTVLIIYPLFILKYAKCFMIIYYIIPWGESIDVDWILRFKKLKNKNNEVTIFTNFFYVFS